MAKFEHLRNHVIAQVYHPVATWKPPTWNSRNLPPPELIIERPHNTSVRFARAVLNPRLKQVQPRRDGKVREGDLQLRHERNLILFIVACVAGWNNVFEADGKPSPFPGIGEEPNDKGVQEVRELLAMLGPDAESDFLAFCQDAENWRVDDEGMIDVTSSEKGAEPLPLPKPSLPG